MVAAAAITLFIFLYLAVDPAQTWWMPKCPVFVLTGLQCPGCGSQRALHALLHGDAAAAAGHNAFLLLAIPYIILLAIAEGLKNRRPALYRILAGAPAVIAFLSLALLWTLFRNLLQY